ncbi:hypothetical protein N7495_003110 [Penicillium taxi]|uniref:uncharacterized protein n=1 Tax=Penicillium taxi TaxID=168475 RepID=UPI002545A195|nr:uncharacterized protein N7495_003110 [Penicillium taxi]KAJ5902582.1 hypothetical protein N7495_003110 [Penicillium taxi]
MHLPTPLMRVNTPFHFTTARVLKFQLLQTLKPSQFHSITPLMARPKRAASNQDSNDVSEDSHETKRSRPDLSQPHPNANQTEDFGIVLRDFYPPEMSNARCKAYIDGEIERPIETLEKACRNTADKRRSVSAGKVVVHWFKTDLRTNDNRALHKASELAQQHKIPLICLYILSPEDLTAHLISPARVDFALRTLEQLQQDLGKLDIPLYVETQHKRKNIPSRVIELCQQWEAKNLHANIEYEVDELRQDAKLVELCAENDISFELDHDTCVVTPGAFSTKTGGQYAVYTPWFRSWIAFLKENPDYLELSDNPGSNPSNTRETLKDLFDCKIPSAPKNKQLSKNEKTLFKKLYPAGEHEALQRLDAFLKEKGQEYEATRNIMAKHNTSILSPYFASGVLSARTAVSKAKRVNNDHLDKHFLGLMTWISEVAWRDFYRHVLTHWPFIGMNKCFKPEHTNIEWEYDTDQFQAWCDGKTGYPVVDAAMRQLRETAWMHNRVRMVVSSFLSKDMLIDWRRGERFFMESLIDGDFASNHGGWGFGSSTGVDPQPYFRVFNPTRQSERFDPDGEYIRRWVPELRDIKSSAIHEPYARGAGPVAEKNGYPRPIVEHSAGRTKALERFKAALQKAPNKESKK